MTHLANMSIRLRLLLIFLLLVNATSCASIATHLPVEDPPSGVKVEPELPVYKGTYVDIVTPTKVFTDDAPKISIFLLLDLPFSFIADTLLLPYDIYTYSISKDVTRKDD